MKLFITGVTGYIGNKIMLAAIKKGYSVNAFTRQTDIDKQIKHPDIQYFFGNIADTDSLNNAMAGCDAVFHVAGLTQLWNKDRSLFYHVNVDFTRNILEAAWNQEIKKVIFTSSCALLGPSFEDPVAEEDPRITPYENDYEISKHCAEELLKEYAEKGLFTVSVRPSRVYGPGLWTHGNPINKFIRDILKRKFSFVPKTKTMVGNYVFIDDVVEGHFLALKNGLSGEEYNLGGENITYDQFFEQIRQEAGKKIRYFSISKAVLKIGFTLIFVTKRLLNKHTHMNPKIINRLFQNRAVSCDKAVNQLGYRITPFRVGLAQTVQFLIKENYV